VRLAHAPQDELAGLAVVLEPQRGVLGHEPRQGLRELVLVGLGLGPDGDRQEGLRHHPRLHEQRRVLVRERVTRLGAGELRDGADVTGDALRQRALRLAQRGGQRTDPLVEVVVLVPAALAEEGGEVAGDVHDGVGRSVPGEHPDQRDAPDVRVGRGLDDLGDERAAGVAGQRLARLAGGG
jgi:hypothetical protein